MSDEHKLPSAADLDAVAANGAAADATEIPVMRPVCPNCKADPCTTLRRIVEAPDGMIVCSFFCGNKNCRVLFGVAVIGLKKGVVDPSMFTPEERQRFGFA